MEKRKRKRKGERRDGSIQLTITIGRGSDGKPIRKSFYGKTRGEAEKKRSDYLTSLNSGICADSKTMTVQMWIEKWKEMYSPKEEYDVYINNLTEDIGTERLCNVTEGILNKTLVTRCKNRSYSKAMKQRMIIKNVFGAAVRNRLIPYDPSAELKLPETTRGTHRALNDWEINLIMQTWDMYRAGLWGMLMLLCGLRRGELAALDWSAVDLESRTLEVRAAAVMNRSQTTIKPFTKTEAGMRTLPICDPLYNVLQSIPKEERTGLVCQRSGGGVLSRSSFADGWKTYCEKIRRYANGESIDKRGKREADTKNGLVFYCQAHDLRHTYATILFECGMEPKDMQYYLGHSDYKITLDLYTHLRDERKNKQRSALYTYMNKWLYRQDKIIAQIGAEQA